MVTIDYLPDEVLELVFSKLTLTDRKKVRLVNKKWLWICNSSSITRHEQTAISYFSLCKLKIPKEHLNLRCCVESRSQFSKEQSSTKLQNKFWIRHGPSVRSLDLRIYNQPPCMIPNIVNYCPDISDLSLIFVETSRFCNIFNNWPTNSVGVDLKEGANLDRLVSLTLGGTLPLPYLSGPEFEMFSDSIKNLKKLKIGCFSRDYYRDVNFLMSIIEKQALTLIELTFEHCTFATDSFFKNVIEIIGPQLISLRFRGISLTCIDCLSKHASKFSNLKYLELTCMNLFSNDSLSVFLHLKSLQYISFNTSNTGLSMECIKTVAALENLKGLDIGYSSYSADAILTFFGTKTRTNMIALVLSREKNVTDDVLAAILPNLPNLQLLDLSFCQNIKTKGAQVIFSNCPQLTHLSLRFGKQIKNVMEPTSINSLVNLIYLDLGYCSGLDSKDFLNFRFDKLKDIALDDVFKADGVLTELFKNCSKLKYSYTGRMKTLSIFDFS